MRGAWFCVLVPPPSADEPRVSVTATLKRASHGSCHTGALQLSFYQPWKEIDNFYCPITDINPNLLLTPTGINWHFSKRRVWILSSCRDPPSPALCARACRDVNIVQSIYVLALTGCKKPISDERMDIRHLEMAAGLALRNDPAVVLPQTCGCCFYSGTWCCFHRPCGTEILIWGSGHPLW